ncbi:hypothetical protein ACFJIY_02225 [Pimelobacter simplex]|uniref:DUF6630 family protein n=1 Tax=Nocardioides simplex TaxID=2045 RepID=UPI00366ED6DC
MTGEVLVVDWSGEEHEGQLAAFVAGRLRALGVGAGGDGAGDLDLGSGPAYDDPAARRGDVVPRVLDHLAERVRAHGRTLAVRDEGDDAYHVLVLDAGEVPHPPVRAWGAPAGAGGGLVSLTCPACGSMQVWDLPPGETLAGEACDCGTPLFDDDARPLPGVVVDS